VKQNQNLLGLLLLGPWDFFMTFLNFHPSPEVSQALMAIALNGEKERISVHEEHVW